MKIAIDFFVSLAAAAVFFLTQNYLLSWSRPWDIVATAVVFIVSLGLALRFNKNASSAAITAEGVMSGNRVQEDMKASIEGSSASRPTAKVLSGNTVGGNADFKIKDSDL
ncbi:hypothetical protein [Bradyrhizobium sp. HKCCYLRH3061]|uniref:hypothetical protein n=1 Tax=Bradyrhizobium TaxID=374 RepID=UPI003EBC4EAD